MNSVAELTFYVKTLIEPDEFMEIDIRPPGELLPWAAPASLNPASVYLASLSRGSWAGQAWALNLAAAVLTDNRCTLLTLPWASLRLAHTKALRAWLVGRRKASTCNKVLSAVRGALRAAWEMDQLSTDDYMRAISVKNVRGEEPDQGAGRAVSQGELAALLAVCEADRSAAGVRDLCILGLGVLGGLRRAELSGLRLADLRGSTLWVTGKGRKTRTVPVASGLREALTDWLYLRQNCDNSAFFLRVDKAGVIQNFGLTDDAIWSIVKKRSRQAGIAALSPHDMRRTFVGDLLDAGADLVTVQRLVGHANTSTTARYDRRGERAKEEAVGRLHLRYCRRFTP